MTRLSQDISADLERLIIGVLESDESFIRYGEYGVTSSCTNERGETFYAPEPSILAMLASALSGLTIGVAAIYCGTAIRGWNQRSPQASIRASIVSALMEEDAQQRRTAIIQAQEILASELHKIGLPTRRANRAASSLIKEFVDELTGAIEQIRSENDSLMRSSHLSSSPYNSVRHYRIILFEALRNLTQQQFKQVLLRTCVEQQCMSSPQAPQATRAIELIYLAEQNETGLNGLANAIRVTAPNALSPRLITGASSDIASMEENGSPIITPPLIYLLAHSSDQILLRDLEQHLTPLAGRGLVRLFAEHHIQAGADQWTAMLEHLDQASLVLPLISAELLASLPHQELLQRARDRQKAGQANLIPVLARHCTLEFSLLAGSKVLPLDGRPVTAWPDPNAAWTDVVRGAATALGINLKLSQFSPDIGIAGPASAIDSTALILVAVTTESKALLVELRDQCIEPAEEKVGGRYVDTFLLRGRGRTWRVVVGQSVEKGPHSAQSLVQHLVRELQPEAVLLVGMCGGLSERGAKGNTVLVARHVFHYEPARLRDGKAAMAPTAYRTAAVITDLVNRIGSKGILPDIDLVAGKDYASGEKLIDDLCAPLRQQIMDLSGDLIGFEMEGHGMLHALWEMERDGRALQAAMIKGVSDFGDGQMREDKQARQIAATRRAVRVALEILRRY